MKIAYLITAYIDAPHLKRLIDSLNYTKKDDSTDFYIHIDKKCNIQEFTSIINGSNMYFLNKRYKISWGAYSQVESLLELLKKSLQNKKEYNRFVCISGTDYPLFTNKEIFDEFKSNPNKEYLIGYNITKGKSKIQKYKLKYYWFMKSNSKIRINIFLPIKKKIFSKINGKEIYIFFGSDYWALSRECAIYVLNTYLNNEGFSDYLRHCYVPSEMFVQTIVFNSEYRKNIIEETYEYKGLDVLTPLHYIEYGIKIKVFEEEDFENLVRSKKMFFRKALTGKSDKLMDRIDLYRGEHQ